MGEGDTITNAIVGAVVTSVAFFIPVLNIIAPLFGSGVSGYMQKGGPKGGVKAGAAAGFIMFLPGLMLGALFSWMFSFIPAIGDFLAGSTILLALIIMAYSIVIGVVGGAIGGAVAS